ncbi:phosphoadenylyl-sulfate reductase [Alteribacter populi]|uniref:phosphoadenylyl-sulfate reductase n=1 Tax=Alteribacter populi TaxID=2011011 RepID=UPI000BBAA9AB|nr:phosphoadenylyl-sulfate reductase [Alteribacter populi]
MDNNVNQADYHTFSEKNYQFFNHRMRYLGAQDVISWAFNFFDEKLVYACSFGAEGMVLLDMISHVKKDARVVFLDTHVHFRETYDVIDRVKEKYPQLQIEMVQPELSLDEQKERYGEKLWKTQPDLCCDLRKNKPLKKALVGSTAWLSGLRRDQSPTRANTEFVNKDEKFQLIKVCPLIHWSWDDVWQYIEKHHLPYNPLHDQGYPSIGCEPCTFAVKEGEDLRAGRWSGLEKTECGLHLKTTNIKE